MLRPAWFIAINDLKYMLRQRETLVWTFLIPPLMFYFVGTITAAGVFGGGVDGGELIGVQLESDAGFLGEQIVSRLNEQNFVVQRIDALGQLVDENGNVIELEDPPGFADYFRRIRIPSGFTGSVLRGERVQLVYTTGGEELDGDLDTLRLNRAVYTVLADVLAASGVATDARVDLTALTAGDIEAFRNSVRALTLEVSSSGRRIPSGFEQSVPGVTVMFSLFVLLTSGATTLLIERRSGILRRLASAPIRRGAIVLGKWGGKFGLAVIQVGFALLVGRIVLGVDYGPELPMLILTLGAYTALIASLGLLAGNFATSEGQAVAVGVLAANVLAALGGCFWPIEVTPAYMQQIALFLPTGWMMDAMHKLMIFDNEWTAVLPHLLGMSAGAWLLGVLCSRKFRFA